MKVLFLGLNPKKMGGFEENDLQRSIKKNLRSTLEQLKEKHGKKLVVLSRMMLGPEFWAIEIANDTMYGLGAGVWTRDAHELYQVPRAIQAGRVWVNQYHAYPAGAPFGGYKQSGIGRETHKMMLGHYRQTKNMLISYDKNKLGFF